MRLKNRVALITGSSRSIGKGIALGLAREGARVVVNYLVNKAAAQDVVKMITGLGSEAVAVKGDVTDEDQVHNMVQWAEERFGRIDILVNNVGVFHWKALEHMSRAEWSQVLASNLDSVFLASKEVLPLMKRNGWGRIVNIGAAGAERAFGQAKISAYTAAKAGVVAFTRSLALEVARFGITVNVVNPPIVDEEMTVSQAIKLSDARFPAGRPVSMEDISEAVIYFASEEAGFVTGQVITVAGGWML